jgi:hypothetical protein
VLPIDRSISPADRTNAIPIAMTETIAVWRRMFMKLSAERKPLSNRTTEKKARIARKLRYTM